MSENETQQALAAAEIPEVQLAETELEQVSGGSLFFLPDGRTLGDVVEDAIVQILT